MPHHTVSDGRRSGGAGFTLVELLVVIAILAVLLSLLLPGIRRIQETSRTVQCVSNFRTMGQAILGFTADRGGRLPGSAQRDMPTSSSVDWSEIINREYFGLKRQISFAGKGTYIPRVGQPGKGALACPNYDWQAVSNSRPYKINVNVTGGVAPSGSPPPYAQLVTDPRQIEPFYASYYLGTQLSRFRNPGYKFLVNEGDRYSDGANSSLPAPGFLTFGDDPLIPLPWAANGGSFSFRHNNYTRMNVVFLDGHVESLTVKDEVNSRRRFQLTD